MNTKAIIFDKDGTLLDFDSYWVTVSRVALADILAKTDAVDVTVDDLLLAIGVHDGVTDIDGILCWGTYAGIAEVLHQTLVAHGCTMPLDRFTEIALDAYHRYVGDGIMRPTCDNLREALSALKERGFLLAVVTTDDPYTTDQCLLGLGVRDLFDCLCTDDGICPPKPDPRAVHDLCKKYGLSLDEIVMVGDTLTDMRFAKNAGIRAIGVAKNEKNRKILSTMTDTVVHDVSFVGALL